MAILGGSPLGLIGVRSTPTRDGMSTFNAGDSRNVNIFYYNSGGKGQDKVGLVPGTDHASLFTGRSNIKPWPNIGVIATDKSTTGSHGSKNSYKGIERKRLHNNNIYDTSLLNIIEMLSSTPAALRPGDFAYLRDIGVYPNNRLMVARRFSGPVNNNIYGKTGQRSISTLISWKPENKDFLSFSFGEEWENGDGDFTNLLNSLGGEFKKTGTSKLGSIAGGGAGAIPLPGFTEQLQRSVLEKLGIYEKGSSNNPLPSGDPNLIKIAKKRKTIGYGKAGSGLKANISIQMTCVYEQKFISGIDPTIVWQDLISNILTFGTSISHDYGLSPGVTKKMAKWVKNPKTLVEEVSKAIKGGLDSALEGIKNTLEDTFKVKTKAEIKAEKVKKADEKPKTTAEKKAAFGKLSTDFGDAIKETISSTVQKYEQELRGIIFALSGLPSTPWHITLGNPLRPVFSSGDMLVNSVNVKLGPDLAFNDLPTRITVDFELKNARPLGLQEIMARFNTGYIRVIDPSPDSTTVAPGQVTGGNTGVYDHAESTNKPTEVDSGTSATNAISSANAGVDTKNVGKTSENAETQVINPDAGSGSDPIPVIKEGGNTEESTTKTEEEVAALEAARIKKQRQDKLLKLSQDDKIKSEPSPNPLTDTTNFNPSDYGDEI